jgi:hypothetical protein
MDHVLRKLRWQSNIASVLNQRKERSELLEPPHFVLAELLAGQQRKTLEAHCLAVLQCPAA